MLHVQEDSLLSGILLTLRRSLNNCAEIAGSESLTSSIVTSFLSAYHPDLLLTELGGHGVAAVYEGLAPGPTVLLRADLDALAVEAGADPSHGLQSHAAHRCGHDGHMTIVAGLAPLLSQRRPAAGRVVLLFQPAEETGEGAQAVIDDPRFALIRPDLAIGLHNLPGYPRHAIVYRNGTFCCASIGMRIDLVGADAHAAEPERACSPARALSLLLTQLPTHSALNSAPFRLVTVTHARLGEESYGVTPGTGVLCATLRSSANSALDQLCGEIESLAQTTAAAEKLGCTIRRCPTSRKARSLPTANTGIGS